MKILVISQYYYPDPFRLHEVTESLAERGHNITVLTGTPNYIADVFLEDKDEKIYSEELNGVKVIRVKTVRRKTSLKSIALSYVSYVFNASIKAKRLSKDYDVVFVYQLSPIIMAIPGFIYAKRANKKIALYCLDLWPESIISPQITHDGLLYKVMKKYSRYVYNHVDSLAYTSILFKKYFTDILRLKQNNYIYIPQFAENIYQNIKLKPHEEINYVFAGNIGESQDVENIVQAAALVKDERIKWHIVGDGRNLKKCQTLAKNLNLDNKVFFYGRRPISEMPKFFSMADAMIVTLKNDEIISYTLPGKVQSYMAAGKAIIGAATGEVPLIVNEAKCGMCCEPGIPESLAKIAEDMAIIDRSQYEINSKQYYLRHFTREKHIAEIEKMLIKLC